MEKSPNHGLSLREAADLLEILGEANRLQIAALLAQRGEVSVSDLCEATGLSQPALSHHLAVLRFRRIIECRRQGRLHFYRLQSTAAEQVLRLLCGSKIVRWDEPQRQAVAPPEVIPDCEGKIQGDTAASSG